MVKRKVFYVGGSDKQISKFIAKKSIKRSDIIGITHSLNVVSLWYWVDSPDDDDCKKKLQKEYDKGVEDGKIIAEHGTVNYIE